MLRIGTSLDRIIPSLNNFALCATRDDPIADGVTQTFACQALGRFLIIQKEENQSALTLCEVKVFEGND